MPSSSDVPLRRPDDRSEDDASRQTPTPRDVRAEKDKVAENPAEGPRSED